MTGLAHDLDTGPMVRRYWREITGLAEEYKKQPPDEAYDWLWETIDGHEWIIYTYNAKCLLIHCTYNESAYEDEIGSTEDVAWEARAMMAMLADVMDQI